jgi:hypothetical protein
MIVDQYGLIRAGTDGGDSLQRTYSFYLLVRLLAYPTNISPALPSYVANLGILQPWNAQKLFETSPGEYIRNPQPGWCADTRYTSRDQLTPVICFLATMANSPTKEFRDQFRPILTRLLVACLKRGMFAQNIYTNGVDPATATWKLPDFLLPDLWATFARGYVRSWAAPIAIPVILFGDAFQILGSLFKVFMPINKDGTLQFRLPGPDDVDDTNINNVIMASQWNWPTPFSWLARKIYKVFRRPSNGNTQLGETSNIMGAIAWYNHNDDPELTELSRPLVERY